MNDTITIDNNDTNEAEMKSLPHYTDETDVISVTDRIALVTMK